MIPVGSSAEMARILRECEAQQQRALDAVRKVADWVEALELPPPAAKTVLYQSQWGRDADEFRSDCGPACLAMMLSVDGKFATVDSLSEQCGLGAAKKCTTSEDLARVAAAHGLKLEIVDGKDLAFFAQHLPAICLIHYGDIRQRLDKGYTGGHWVVLLKVTQSEVIVHDPDWWTQGGAHFRIPRAEFEAAVANCKLDYGNPVGHGLVLA